MKNVPKPSAKSVLTSLGLTASASATDTAIQKKIFGSGTTKLVFSNEDLHDIMKIIKSLEEDDFLITGVSETIKMKQKNKKVDLSTCC